MFLEDIKHEKSDKLYIAYITKEVTSEGPIGFLDVKHSSFYLDEVIKSVFDQGWFWAKIYTFEDVGIDNCLTYVYDIDDDGNIYNFYDHWKEIAREVDGRELNTEEEVEEFIDEFTSSLDQCII